VDIGPSRSSCHSQAPIASLSGSNGTDREKPTEHFVRASALLLSTVSNDREWQVYPSASHPPVATTHPCVRRLFRAIDHAEIRCTDFRNDSPMPVVIKRLADLDMSAMA